MPLPARVGILRGVPLSWNEIRHRAITFAKEWKGETREAAERQTFWNEFFNVFGVRCRTVATFEEPVKKLSGDWGFIDLFWPGRMLGERRKWKNWTKSSFKHRPMGNSSQNRAVWSAGWIRHDVTISGTGACS